MEAWILDQNAASLAVLDTFQSFIWTDRYRGYGDFEIYMPAETSVLSYLKEGNYLVTKDSDRMMIIEDIQVDTDAENGNHLIVTGRSLESILCRRVIWGYKVLNGNFQDAIRTLLNENVIAPSNSKRKIPNFVFRVSTDTRITGLTVDTQFLGENLYDAILSLCEEKEIGFRVLPDGSGGFLFELYVGEDRSYAQSDHPWVIFSPDFENILSSNYLESSKNLRTVSLVGGEGEGAERVLSEATDDDGGGTGLSRREMFTDAAGVSKLLESSYVDDEGNTVEATYMTDAEYDEQLKQKGKEELAKSENSVTKSFEGEIDGSRQFVYKKDFNIGDVVQVVNEYGQEATSRVTEIVISQDENGESLNPTFTSTEKTDN